jgi:hypothetical protein
MLENDQNGLSRSNSAEKLEKPTDLNRNFSHSSTDSMDQVTFVLQTVYF